MTSWFGPDKEAIWKQLALEIGANYSTDGWTGAKVQASHGEWQITLDAFSVTTLVGDVPVTNEYTRLRTPYLNRDGFRFSIFNKTIFSDFGKWLGMQDVDVGYPEFDEAFIIQGTDDKKLCHLFGNAKIREQIQGQPAIALEVRGDQGWFARIFPEGVDELVFQTEGIIPEVDRLKALFDLFCLTLDQLHAIGSADRKSPGVEL